MTMEEGRRRARGTRWGHGTELARVSLRGQQISRQHYSSELNGADVAAKTQPRALRGARTANRFAALAAAADLGTGGRVSDDGHENRESVRH
jgi:hypothetical protein